MDTRGKEVGVGTGQKKAGQWVPYRHLVWFLLFCFLLSQGFSVYRWKRVKTQPTVVSVDGSSVVEGVLTLLSPGDGSAPLGCGSGSRTLVFRLCSDFLDRESFE